MQTMKIFIGSCPRCGGTRFQDRDGYGWFVDCLICGYVTYPSVDDDGPVRDSGLSQVDDVSEVAVSSQSA